MIATYRPGVGMQVMLQGGNCGFTIVLPLTMSVAAIANHLREVQEWLS